MFTNNHTMTDWLAGLFGQVISAAKEGRYCHGNGAIWCIVEETYDGQYKNVVINTSEINFDGKIGRKEYVDTPNPVAPYKADNVVNSLEQYLDLQTGSVESRTFTQKEFSVNAFNLILSDLLNEAVAAGKEGRCLHFNGAELYFKKDNGLIRVVDFSIRGVVQVSDFGSLATRKYMKFNADPSASRAASQYWAEEAVAWYRNQGVLINA